jgi:hypothetical protein
MSINHLQRPRTRVSRRAFLGGVMSAGALAGTALLPHASARAGSDNANNAAPNPIPGAGAPFAPFGIIVHHNPLNPAIALANINDPSQVTDFDGIVGLTHIRGGRTGTNTITGETMSLAYQADMGFSQGRFISTDGQVHQGTFASLLFDWTFIPVRLDRPVSPNRSTTSMCTSIPTMYFGWSR